MAVTSATGSYVIDSVPVIGVSSRGMVVAMRGSETLAIDTITFLPGSTIIKNFIVSSITISASQPMPNKRRSGPSIFTLSYRGKNQIVASFNNLSHPGHLTLFDASGKIVAQKAFAVHSAPIVISCGTLAKGPLFALLSNGSKTIWRTIVVVGN